ncbi:hypothetical protein PPYR_10705 [Photinus pyralis]|uniref:tRNA-splicing endonuclease subunit Sen15 domain-containing protein n=2 Tax=Photinus pyralis TaxID=7054 RepID=A0A5N4AH62_PHOPY|nr:uncharacterized protein LOC116174770 [Photinus pyralis]KAB0796644.1 hypothetical protein PPYR_10705 [Photinus pyralis]
MIEFLREEFTKLGCQNPKSTSIAIQVYLELCEVKRYWDVKYFYNENLDSLYFSAKPTKDEEECIFFPIEVSRTVSLKYLQDLFQLCKNPEHKLIVVLVNSDSTSVYYQIYNGLMQPVEDSKNVHQETSRRIDSNLRRHRDAIEQAAICGISLTLPTTSKGEGT